MYIHSVKSMSAIVIRINALTAASGRCGKKNRMSRTTNKSAVHTLPNHMAPSSILPLFRK